MKKLKLLILFLFSILSIPLMAQVSTGQEQPFETGIQNLSTQTVTSPTYIVTQGVDGTYGKVTPANLINQTTAGTFSRVNFTGDVSTVNAVNYYVTSTTSKGSVASVAQTVSPDDDQKLYFAQDYISILQPSLVIYPPGSYSGQFAVQVANNSVQQKFYIEIYKTNNLGVPIASGVSGAPVGSLGVQLITTLESGLVSLTGSTLTNITLTGTLTGTLTLNPNERVKYHIAAEKVGTAGGTISMQIFSGTNYNSYYDVPVPVTTDGVVNKVPGLGDTSTDALTFLNTNKSDKANFINIKDLGGIGNGIFDNTTIINNALLTYKEVYFPEGNYLVTSLVNDFGSKITGSGVIVKEITGGNQQLNTGIDRYNYISGQEYLSFVQNKIINRGAATGVNIKVSWSGDSTTAGDGTTSGFTLSELFKESALVKGISNVTSLNRGHSGENTEQWRATRLAGDLAENPDLYIIRWGINDASRGLAAFELSLRTGLETLRASKTQAQMSVILMSPNTTSDTPNGRDEKWYEQVRKIYIQAARDYKCAYIDTYSLWLDSRGAADLYMDNPYADGRAIHPKNVFNTWIVSKVFDLVFPSVFSVKNATNQLVNESSVDRLPVKADLPETYRRGFSINRAFGVPAWSVDGTATTFFNSDGAGYQFNTSINLATPRIFYRSFMNDYLVTPLAWSNEVELWHTGNLTPITGTGTSGQVTFWNGSTSQTGSSGLTWDNTSRQLKVSDGTVNTQIYSTSAFNGGFIGTTTNHPLVLQTNNSGKVTIQTNGDLTVNSFAGTGTRTIVSDADGNLSATATPPDPRPYKVYSALISQTGTSAPVVVNVYENTLGFTPTWTRTSVGTFSASGTFVGNKTQVLFQFSSYTTGNAYTSAANVGSTVTLITASNGALTDGISGYIEIKVYP